MSLRELHKWVVSPENSFDCVENQSFCANDQEYWMIDDMMPMNNQKSKPRPMPREGAALMVASKLRMVFCDSVKMGLSVKSCS